MKNEKLSNLILAKDQKESLMTENKEILTSIENSNIIIRIIIENKVFTEIILPNEDIDSATRRICNKYEVPSTYVKNEISKRKNEIKKIEHSFYDSLKEKSKGIKGVSFEVSSFEKKNPSSNRTQNPNVSSRSKFQGKLNNSHNVHYIPINKSPKKNISQFQTTNSSNVSIGKRLYETARSMNVEKDKEINSFRQESIKKTQEECTFTPKINKNSIILSFKKNYNSNHRIPHCLQNSPPKLNSKTVEVDLSSNQQKYLYIYSRKIAEPSQKELELFNKLYKEGELLEKNKEILSEEVYSKYPFKPNVNDKSEPNIKNFYDRLETWTEKKKVKDNSYK